MKRLWPLILLALFAALAGCGKKAPPPRPNIIVIVADDLGYGELGSYGQRQIETPNLDRLATEGIRFTQAYAGSSVCQPSRTSLLTGFHTGHSPTKGNFAPPLPAGTGTLATLLQPLGYATGLVGKWDSGPVGSSGSPNAQGFGHFFGYDNLVAAHNYWPAFLWWNDQQVPLANVVREVPVDYADATGGVATERVQYAPDLLLEGAQKFIAAEHAAGHPVFLLYTPTLPHANNEAGNEGMEIPDAGRYTERDWPQAQRNHAAMITRLDDEVGRLRAQIEELGMADNTIIIFTSDNGPHREGGADPEFFDSNGPLRGAKRDLYEGGIRVPLIVWGAGIERGVDDTPVALWDLYATLQALTEADGEARDGMPLPFAADDKPTERVLYWENHEEPVARAVRFGDWKLIEFPNSGRSELYNLANDAAEKHDLAATEPEQVKKALELIEKNRATDE
ncbi:MAG: arylsulfatase [Verrucomicrobiota bacterium JB022]|nr:arylsulfatase [Verrucomicrobiota bacterium JB022]